MFFGTFELDFEQSPLSVQAAALAALKANFRYVALLAASPGSPGSPLATLFTHIVNQPDSPLPTLAPPPHPVPQDQYCQAGRQTTFDCTRLHP